jgi:hypothetical protein
MFPSSFLGMIARGVIAQSSQNNVEDEGNIFDDGAVTDQWPSSSGSGKAYIGKGSDPCGRPFVESNTESVLACLKGKITGFKGKGGATQTNSSSTRLQVPATIPESSTFLAQNLANQTTTLPPGPGLLRPGGSGVRRDRPDDVPFDTRFAKRVKFINAELTTPAWVAQHVKFINVELTTPAWIAQHFFCDALMNLACAEEGCSHQADRRFGTFCCHRCVVTHALKKHGTKPQLINIYTIYFLWWLAWFRTFYVICMSLIFSYTKLCNDAYWIGDVCFFESYLYHLLTYYI